MTFTVRTVNNTRVITCDRCLDCEVSPFEVVLRKWKTSHQCETPWRAA